MVSKIILVYNRKYKQENNKKNLRDFIIQITFLEEFIFLQTQRMLNIDKINIISRILYYKETKENNNRCFPILNIIKAKNQSLLPNTIVLTTIV